MHEEALGNLLDVGDGDAGKLAAAEPASEAEGEQEPVAMPGQPRAEARHGGLDVTGGDALLPGGGDAQGPADALHRLPHKRVGAGVGVAGHLVALADGGQPPGDGRDPGPLAVVGGVGQLSHVPCHHDGGRGQGLDAQLLAEDSEVLPVGPVGPQRRRRTAADHGGRHLGLESLEPLGDHRRPARVGHQLSQHLGTLARRCDITAESPTSSSYRSSAAVREVSAGLCGSSPNPCS